MCTSISNYLKLVSGDKHEFWIAAEKAKLSTTLQSAIDANKSTEANVNVDEEIPIQNVSGKVLKLVVDWMNNYKAKEDFVKESQQSDGEIQKYEMWVQHFLKSNDTLLVELLTAANFLEVESLLDTITDFMSEKLKGKSAEEIRAIFKLELDFTQDDLHRIEKENKLVVEK